MSETTAVPPSGETASTLPTTDGYWVTDFALALSTIRPRVPSSPVFVPRYAVVPSRLNSSEFGVAGRESKLPTVEEETPDVVLVVMGASSLMQPSVPSQPVVVTQVVAVTVPEVLTPVARTVTGLGG